MPQPPQSPGPSPLFTMSKRQMRFDAQAGVKSAMDQRQLSQQEMGTIVHVGFPISPCQALCELADLRN